MPSRTPPSPMERLRAWMDDAIDSAAYKDANAMSLATVDADNAPSVRIVLCKAIDPSARTLAFFTNYRSAKGRDMAAHPKVAAVFHWPHAGRQARVCGEVSRMPCDDSDTYFNQRPLLSRIGACTSPQSAVISSRVALLARAALVVARHVPCRRISRPRHWGGCLMHVSSVELWEAGPGRLHHRRKWTWNSDAQCWTMRTLAP